MLLKIVCVDCIYEGYDFFWLGVELQLDCIVIVVDLEKDGIVFFEVYLFDLFLLLGKVLMFIGYLVVILIWNDFECFCWVKFKFKFNDKVICYGVQVLLYQGDFYGSYCFVWVGGKMFYEDDEFFSLKDLMLFFIIFNCKLVWICELKLYGDFIEQGLFYVKCMVE